MNKISFWLIYQFKNEKQIAIFKLWLKMIEFKPKINCEYKLEKYMLDRILILLS